VILAAIDRIQDIALTTNAALLAGKAETLALRGCAG
jgi:molybdenum cofactor biosynthesis enzyme MoaA